MNESIEENEGIQAKPFIFVDDSVLQKSIAFLNSQQMVRERERERERGVR